MTTNLFNKALDTWVNQSAPNLNYANKASLKLDDAASSDEKRVLLKFPLPAVPGATITAATLKVYVRGAWAGTETLTAKRVTAAWNVNRVNWNTKPTVTATNSAAAVPAAGTDGSLISFDVKNMMQDVASGSAWYGIELTINTDTERAIYSSEWTSPGKRPVLSVAYSLDPDTPEFLVPSGTMGVPQAAPRLQWEFGASTEDEAQAASYVDIDNNSDFSSITFSSGWISNVLEWYDTSTHGSPPALTDDTTYYWRVKVRDGNNVESAYSETAEFQRRSLGVVAITAPAADNDDVVSSTPSITHTFTRAGSSQVAVKHIVSKLVNGAYQEIYSEPRVATTELSWSVPESIITTPNGKYKVEVRVWDTFVRPDSDFATATRIFDYVPAGVAPASVSAVATANSPKITITWTYASAADSFIIRADGIEVARPLYADVWVSGTSFSYTYYGAPPRIATTYTVAAHFDTPSTGDTSDSTGSAATITPVGVWLVETSGQIEVPLYDAANIDATIDEDGETFYPQNAKLPVRITSRVGGYMGTVSGIIIGDKSTSPTVSPATYLARLEQIKRDYTTATTVRLIFGRRNIPVLIGEVNAPEWSAVEEIYNVSFPYWQTGEFE